MCKVTKALRPTQNVFSLSTFINKKCKTTAKKVNVSHLLNKRFRKALVNSTSEQRNKKDKRQERSSKSKSNSINKRNSNSSAEPTILGLLTTIGEQDKSQPNLDHKNILNYSDRDLLKISDDWSRAISGDESHIALEIDDDDNISDILIRSLTPDCASLEVEAMSLLAFLEREIEDETSECALVSDVEVYDDEMEEEINQLDESEELLQRELYEIEYKAELVNKGGCIVHRENPNWNVNELKSMNILKEVNITVAACA